MSAAKVFVPLVFSPPIKQLEAFAAIVMLLGKE
jgi:hypothetical protein